MHTGHTRVDLKRPWKISTMMESFLLMWFCQASSATTCRRFREASVWSLRISLTHSHTHTRAHTHAHTHTHSHSRTHTRTHSHAHTVKTSQEEHELLSSKLLASKYKRKTACLDAGTADHSLRLVYSETSPFSAV